ncbi:MULTISPECIES: single-stranded DNA-binding protein [Prochlorococcus]|uniref:single-stranded DNA-binding protein n=1 Tax=Prochlorococcus TaxID=1218 RepID=UPI000533A6D7|nr:MULTISPECIES: single-stranded DNA-binding protein [Prochlorococcus]KGG12889.1 Single-stranded DNA-binding protein [Prochlorococcus sp. MIT 0601]
MNHCLLEAVVRQAPTIRYTQGNTTPIAEMEVSFNGLRADDPQGFIKVIGWGNLAQELQNNIHVGQKLVLEGRLRMNTIPRQDGTKEKKAEFTLARFHSISEQSNTRDSSPLNTPEVQSKAAANSPSDGQPSTSWDSSPLIPDTDEIPF